jgi:hypothetical protein
MSDPNEAVQHDVCDSEVFRDEKDADEMAKMLKEAKEQEQSLATEKTGESND